MQDEYGRLTEEKYELQGLNCSSCAAKIENAVNDLPQINEAVLNFAAGTINIKYSEEMANMKTELQRITDKIEPGLVVKKEGKGSMGTDNREYTCEDGCQHEAEEDKGDKENRYLFRFAVGSILFIMALVLYELPVFRGSFPYWLELILYGTSYILIGGPIVMAALHNIRQGRLFDENFLMTVATLGAFVIHEFPEGVAVMLFYMVGEMFQERAVDRSRRSIKNLMDIRPDYANLKKGNKIRSVSPETVHVGEIILIKPGEKVPLDGEVITGDSLVDTSALTGESVPRKLEEGDRILSGMINKEGLLEVKVTKEYSQSTVSRILDLVENASVRKAPTEKFITKFARYYTPVVVYTALAIAIIPPFLIQGALFSDWFYRALIFLVISCPCALVVSIPLGFFGGIGRTSRQGILVKGGNYLEALNNVRQIVFDKTGTLTEGVFAVNTVNTFNGFTEDQVLKLAALAETHSNHPIAKSILEAYDGIIKEGEIESYQEISGHGVKVRAGGKEILAGNLKLMEKENINFEQEKAEGTIVYIAVDGEYAGYLTISDQIKEDTKTAINKLKAIGVKELVMLTGDREAAARQVAQKLGLDTYYAELLPDQKVKKVEDLLQSMPEKGKLAFVGDGINDAPVLARADIGIAMGGLGSDAAIEAADVVLMTDEPSKLVTAIKTARNTRRIIWQNIIMALGVKGIVLIFGAFGLATMWEAVFADVGVALLAVLNSMRVLNHS